MDIERIWGLARRAEKLLPDAPDAGDVLGWLSWRELVWDTAHRLGRIGGPVLRELGLTGMDDASATSVSAEQLLRLGILVQTKRGEVFTAGRTATGAPMATPASAPIAAVRNF